MIQAAKAFAGQTKSLAPDDADLAAIKKAARRDVKAEDIYAGSMLLANDAIDRSHERFTPEVLARFAETIVGKALLAGHDYSTMPLGRFYAASVVHEGGGKHLQASFYMPRKNEDLIASIELGVLKDVSIGFRADKRLCDLCGHDYDGFKAGDEACSHIAGQEYDGKTATVTYGGDLAKYEAMEGSLVWLGCQRGAELTGNAAAGDTRTKAEHFAAQQGGEESMELKEAMAEIDRLKAELAKAGDAGLAADGKAYREHLKAEITRMAGVMEKTGTYTAVLKHMDAADSASLTPIVDELKKEVEARFPAGTHGKAADPPPPADKENQERKVFDPRRSAPIPAGRA